MDKNTSQSKDSVLVTICCTAYNQEKFIKQCLDGFVMQKTKFRFEAVVHDDASTDNTAAIIKEYAGKYPEIIKPIFEKENQYSKHNGSLRRIMRENMRGKYIAMRGKYIATCEADDYWTDPYKLQKQVDILEADPNVSMVYTAFRTVDPNGDFMPRPIYEKYKKISFSGDILCQLISSGNFIMTLTTCIRRDVYKSNIMTQTQIGLDYLLFLTAALMGKAAYLSEETGCYRYSPQSEMNANLGYVKSSYIKAKKYFVKEFLNSGIKSYTIKRRICIYLAILENALTFYVKGIDKEYFDIVMNSKRKILLLIPVAIFRLTIKKIKRQ